MARRKGRKARRREMIRQKEQEMTKREGGRRVAIQKGEDVSFPALYLDVYIQGDEFEQRNFAPMFARSACRKAKSIEEADLVVFTGGADVDPALYGEKPHHSTHISKSRDERDIEAFNKCIKDGIPMFGVCRGLQFIHVMLGGTLYQDVDGHNRPHDFKDARTGVTYTQMSSVHHQMVRDDGHKDRLIVATASASNRRALGDHTYAMGTHKDIEAVFYRDVCAFGTQGHPEYSGYEHYTKWCLDRISEFVLQNTDLVRINHVLRLPESYRDQRQTLWAQELVSEVDQIVSEAVKGIN